MKADLGKIKEIEDFLGIERVALVWRRNIHLKNCWYALYKDFYVTVEERRHRKFDWLVGIRSDGETGSVPWYSHAETCGTETCISKAKISARNSVQRAVACRPR